MVYVKMVKFLYEKFLYLLNCRNFGINIEICCTYVNLGLLLLFLCKRNWTQFMAILYGVAARCLFGVVFLHNAKQGR